MSIELKNKVKDGSPYTVSGWRAELHVDGEKIGTVATTHVRGKYAINLVDDETRQWCEIQGGYRSIAAGIEEKVGAGRIWLNKKQKQVIHGATLIKKIEKTKQEIESRDNQLTKLRAELDKLLK
jgi:hypothetical protein